MGTIIVLLMVADAVALSVRSMVKRKKSGKSLQCGCGCGCESCRKDCR